MLPLLIVLSVLLVVNIAFLAWVARRQLRSRDLAARAAQKTAEEIASRLGRPR